MALLARTFRTVVGLPRTTFELLDWAMRWSAIPVELEEPTSEVWARDLFAPCSTKSCLLCSIDDDTDSSGSEICDEDDEFYEKEWSDCESDDEELDGFSFRVDGDIDFWGDRWFWAEDDESAISSCSDFIDLSEAEQSSYAVERVVDYLMPSMELNPDAAVDTWVDKYGSSRSQVRFVTVSLSEFISVDSSSALVLSSTPTGLFVAVL